MIKNVNKLHKQNLSISDKFALKIAAFAGSITFINLHTAWFILWFYFKLDINLLTLIVSLEAIYLSTFVMINQNQQDKKNRLELDHDYEVNRQAEKDIKALHEKLDRLEAKIK